MMWLTGNNRWLKNAAFSLVELLIVIVVISSLLVISLPRFRSTFNQLMFDNFCNTLASRINYLHERAYVEQKSYRLNFDLGSRAIKIEFQKEYQNDFIPCKGLLGKNITIPKGMEIKLRDNFIYFYPDSTSSGEYIAISGFGNKLVISINKTTGYIKIHKDE
ncbi:MAG: prepilin-type N-terminal cleavage/methylation domain-containing protein [Candidatus Omnitrophica bacterium]|nr:prepilin-type N-terminal cleavage/methylation domain-containing protein [Candidatus Omnitrophota bacterium]